MNDGAGAMLALAVAAGCCEAGVQASMLPVLEVPAATVAFKHLFYVVPHRGWVATELPCQHRLTEAWRRLGLACN